MARTPLALSELLDVVASPQSVADVASYFRPPAEPGGVPPYTGSRFESFAAGGDHPAVADRVTAEDLVAVTLLSVDVPGRVALQLLEGPLGDQVAVLLAQVPTDVALHEPGAGALLEPGSPVRQAWDLLEAPHGMGWVIAGKVLARKRPHLIPVYDNVVRCALGAPTETWTWLRAALTADSNSLTMHLRAIRDAGVAPVGVSLLRVLDVILWMAHHGAHQQSRCFGLTLDESSAPA